MNDVTDEYILLYKNCDLYFIVTQNKSESTSILSFIDLWIMSQSKAIITRTSVCSKAAAVTQTTAHDKVARLGLLSALTLGF